MESDSGLWIMRQTWRDLLFAHWRIPMTDLRRAVPEPLELDTFDGEAWIAVVPFGMTGIRGRWLPPLPRLNRSLELNVRTYVRYGDRAGVYFFSLDAERPALVYGARATYRLPYFRARMSWDGTRYMSTRIHRNASPAELDVTYAPTGPPFNATAGSLESFLTDRYSLLTVHRDRVFRADIFHEPWPLQPASASLAVNTMTASLGIALSGDPLLHFSQSIEVRIGPLRACSGRLPAGVG
jgi:uncharacterized protein YqjF (DUF2071 family)